MRSILLIGTLAHLALVIVMLDANNYGSTWMWMLGTVLALLGMILPFFIRARWEQRWANLCPGLLLATGWAAWLLSGEMPTLVNIWGIVGPVLGVSFLAGLLAISMVLRPRQAGRRVVGLEAGHDETLPPR